MLRALFLGATLATTLGYAAQAQSDMSPSGAPPSSQAPADQSSTQSGADSATTAKPGMVVKDTSGGTVGTVVKVGQATNGQTAVVVNIDGKPISLAANMLTPAGDGLVCSMTKDQIKAAAAKQSG
jgi:hypothetical protein